MSMRPRSSSKRSWRRRAREGLSTRVYWSITGAFTGASRRGAVSCPILSSLMISAGHTEKEEERISRDGLRGEEHEAATETAKQ